MTGLALFVFGLLIALSASFGIRGEDDADIIRSLAKEPLERMILRRALLLSGLAFMAVGAIAPASRTREKRRSHFPRAR